MILNDRGEMGFNEAIISMMAVSIVLSLFLVFVATTSISAYDPMDGFNPDSLEVNVKDEVTVSESYMFSCLGIMDIYGLTVIVTVPHFHDDSVRFDIGKQSDLFYSQTYIRILDYDNGRAVPVIIEVIAYA